MTIHTFEVTSMLTGKAYYKIQKDLKAQGPDKWKAKKNGMLYWGLSDNGILINMHIVGKEGFFSYFIIYRISAARVLENDNYLKLFNAKKYNKLEDKVNELLKETSVYLPKLEKCNLRRLDFCVNVMLDNQEQVKAYIKTAKRANVPANLEVYMQYDKKAKRSKPTKDDYTVYSDDYIAVSIYNKYKEMKKQKDGVYPESQIEQAKNIVRLEIRCMEGKIEALKKKYSIKSIADFMLYGDKIGNELYDYYMIKMFNRGSMYTLKEAMSRIERSGYGKKSVELLKEFVKECNESRNAAGTLIEYKYAHGNNKLKQILSMLDDIETSYVTVTNRDIKLFDGYIPNPLELYEEYVA